LKHFCFSIVLILSAAALPALDFWQNPEPAEPGTIFFDVRGASLRFKGGFSFVPELGADFLLPVGFPLSAGAYFKMPEPNLKSFGVRAAYHINLGSDITDLYVLYVFDFGFIRNDLLVQYGDEKQEIHFWDFRVGVRRLFGKSIALILETDYKFQGITAGISLKLF
jgi:hypothetical protein